MAVVYDSVLAGALARELAVRWSGRRLESLAFHRDRRHVRLVFTDEQWLWLLHPRDGVLVALPPPSAGRRRDRGLLDGPRRVASLVSPPDTRRILMELDGPERGSESVVFELVANRWNALYVAEGSVRSVLVPGLGRDPVSPGDGWSPGTSTRRWAEEAPSPDEWAETMHRMAERDGGGVRGRIAWLSGMNQEFVLGGSPAAAASDPRSSLARYLAVRDAARTDPPSGWLLRETGDVPTGEASVRPYAHPVGAPGAEEVGSILDAFAAVADRSSRIGDVLRSAAESPETTRLREALEARRERTARKIRAIESEVERGADAEELRQIGHLLLARKSGIAAGREEVRLEDFSGREVTVALDPQLDVVGNADAYYERARRLERAASELPRRIRTAERRLEKLDAALARLDEEGPDDGAWKLAGGRDRVLGRRSGPSRGGRAEEGDALPYRTYRTSGGREVRAGRSAKGNDALTFHHSAPDDIWMHVREAPGSHVVLRWGDRDQNPPEADLAEAALVAAVLSRARGSGVVPVAWTRRKYVRKPRKAPPGTVVPERTQTIFVEPDAKRVKRMEEEPRD